MFPNRPPIQCEDAIKDASSIEILPDGNGVSPDVSRMIDGLTHPSNAPYPIIARFTIRLNKKGLC